MSLWETFQIETIPRTFSTYPWFWWNWGQHVELRSHQRSREAKKSRVIQLDSIRGHKWWLGAQRRQSLSWNLEKQDIARKTGHKRPWHSAPIYYFYKPYEILIHIIASFQMFQYRFKQLYDIGSQLSNNWQRWDKVLSLSNSCLVLFPWSEIISSGGTNVIEKGIESREESNDTFR